MMRRWQHADEEIILLSVVEGFLLELSFRYSVGRRCVMPMLGVEMLNTAAVCLSYTLPLGRDGVRWRNWLVNLRFIRSRRGDSGMILVGALGLFLMLCLDWEFLRRTKQTED